VTVRVDFNQDPTTRTARQSYVAYFKLKNRFSLYGVAKTGVGFWIPYGLLATNFHSNASGIPLGAFPVGLAFGARLYMPESSAYLGVSVMANWAVYGSTQSQTQTQTMTNQSTGSVNLQSISYGLLVDLSGYVYVGGAYVADYISGPGNKSPGLTFVLGVGPQLLQFLQSAKH
jgi:hypothetical protein